MKAIIRKPYWFLRNWRFQVARAQALWWNFNGQRHYRQVSFSDFWASRRSDTLFILGSGYSVNAITPDEWQSIEQHNTMSFNWFIHQDFLRVDYHIVREFVVDDPIQRYGWEPEMRRYTRLLVENPHYDDCTLLIQGGWMGIAGNRLVGLNLIDPKHRIMRFRNRVESSAEPLPSPRFEDGIVHHLGTLSDAVHLGYLGGWKHLVLVGVDLYDRRSFWLKENELREEYRYTSDKQTATVDTPHNTAMNGIIPFMRRWHEYLKTQGVQMWVYNPRSLLADFMPVYDPPKSVLREGISPLPELSGEIK